MLKRQLSVTFLALLLLGVYQGRGAVLLDDTWADGNRTNQNLPSESAWFASSGTALTAATNSMTMSLAGSAVLGITYFTSGTNNPIQLQVGDTLFVTATISFSGLAAPNTSQGLRLGIFDFADSTLTPRRVAADGMSSSSQGNGVQGYALLQNMGTSFGSSSPMDLRKRTVLTDTSLLGTSGDFASLGTGPGNTNNFPGFSNGSTYVLRLTLQRSAPNTVAFSASWSNTVSAAVIVSSFADTSATNFNFDGLAVRPQNASTAAATLNLTELKIETQTNSQVGPPGFISQPASLIVSTGAVATFAITNSGLPPLAFQWSHDGTAIPGATNAILSILNVALSDAGTYTVAVSNSAGSAMSDPALLTVTTGIPGANNSLSVSGFGRGTTGGGIIAETNTGYRKVYNAVDLGLAVSDASVKVIEIMNDLNLGYNEIPADAKTNGEPFRAHNTPLLHPVLLQTGVSILDIQKKSGLTVFSANGATIRHATFNVKSSGNVIIRNLRFDEMWEWDESTKGQYDRNDWDFIDLGNSGTVSNIWIDHCTFTKAYDGITDIKDGSYNITFSWCKYTGDDGATNTNSWVRQQINALETNRASYVMYNFLRTNGFSVEDIVTICQGHDKTHLIGSATSPTNAQFTVTFHHDWFMNPWDRLPRLRGGNVHGYNLYVDDTLGLAARRLRDARESAMSSGNQNTLETTFSFKPFLNGTISTEGGAIQVEKSVYIDCLTPLRNNQTNPNDPTFTGKIQALDTIYQMDSTNVRGDSTNSGNPLGPFQAPIIPFSWNLTNNQLPYTYVMDDPAQLQSIVSDTNTGAGAGVLTWAKTNWLVTSYAPAAPSVIGQPFNETRAAGQTAAFVAVATGNNPLAYQWYFNTNTQIPAATNSTLTITNVQFTNAGIYQLVVTNSFGGVTSATVSLTVTGVGFTAWQTAHFSQFQLSDPSVSGPNATPAGDGVPNFVKYALGLDPFTSASRTLSGFRMENGTPVLSYERPINVPDASYVPVTSTDLLNWSETNLSQMQAGLTNGLALWEVRYAGPMDSSRFFKLLIER